ncbi:RluA family pseudouridine synthase [Hydrogenibacillus schlegelii]|uniref:RluA family pseudouridine synthase n=1 Tax=Hydrogenibacillus schlegelii TaxID=1484 RepID=UPI0009E67AF1|nr:RluA family pseudouridine synthase [Hydrogenibacillus schlegelii]
MTETSVSDRRKGASALEKGHPAAPDSIAPAPDAGGARGGPSFADEGAPDGASGAAEPGAGVEGAEAIRPDGAKDAGAAAAPAEPVGDALEVPGEDGAGERFFTVGAEAVGLRLDVAVSRALEVSRAQVKKWIEAGRVTVDGRAARPAERLSGGEAIRVRPPAPRPARPRPNALSLRIVYEDAVLAVVDKPPGMSVHPSPGHDDDTLVNALLYHLKALSGIGGELRPGIVHRLDKDTSGLLVVAKTDRAHLALAAQLQARTMKRTYTAVVCGVPAEEVGLIDLPIGRHPVDRKRMAVVPNGRPARTRYRVVRRFRRHSIVEASLETGRTHQIRVHFAAIGHPLVGDPVYGRCRFGAMSRQALHATRLGFRHPETGAWLEFTSPLPPDLTALIDALSKNEA